MRLIIAITACLITSMQCAPAARAEPYAGWERLVTRLEHDGIPESLLRSVYNGTVVPEFDFVPFRLKPAETTDMYSRFISREMLELGLLCRKANGEPLRSAEKLFGVEPAIITAILLVETKCGRSTGKELIVNRLSRVSNIGEPGNLERNLCKQREEDSDVSMKDIETRAAYLERTFYPQLKALFAEHVKGRLDIFSLRGSIAGAFGWPQFLPLTYTKYATDGDKDGRVSLFNPVDAIFSAAHFLAAHGWKKSLNHAEKRKIIWSYNRSDPYIDTVLKLSEMFS